MTKLIWDYFFSEEFGVFNTAEMSYEDRFDLINGMLESYTYYKNKQSIYKDYYRKLLTTLIKKYGH